MNVLIHFLPMYLSVEMIERSTRDIKIKNKFNQLYKEVRVKKFVCQIFRLNVETVEARKGKLHNENFNTARGANKRRYNSLLFE